MKKFNSFIAIIFITILLIFFLQFIFAFKGKSDIVEQNEFYFEFSSNKINYLINNNQIITIDALKFQENNPIEEEDDKKNWTIEKYDKVANDILNQLSQNQTAFDWKLTDILTFWDFAETPYIKKAFYHFEVYEKDHDLNIFTSYKYVADITIYQNFLSITIKKHENVLNTYQLNSIQNENITLSDALQIAQENGGNEELKYCNQICQIEISDNDNFTLVNYTENNISQEQYYINKKTAQLINNDQIWNKFFSEIGKIIIVSLVQFIGFLIILIKIFEDSLKRKKEKKFTKNKLQLYIIILLRIILFSFIRIFILIYILNRPSSEIPSIETQQFNLSSDIEIIWQIDNQSVSIDQYTWGYQKIYNNGIFFEETEPTKNFMEFSGLFHNHDDIPLKINHIYVTYFHNDNELEEIEYKSNYFTKIIYPGETFPIDDFGAFFKWNSTIAEVDKIIINLEISEPIQTDF